MKKLILLIVAACMTCTAAFAQTVKPFKEIVTKERKNTNTPTK